MVASKRTVDGNTTPAEFPTLLVSVVLLLLSPVVEDPVVEPVALV